MSTLHDQQLESGFTDRPEVKTKRVIITINVDGQDLSRQYSFTEETSDEEIEEMIGEKAGDMVDTILKL
jgi:hypothetical protein